MISPPDRSRFCLIRSGNTCNPSNNSIMYWSISPVSIADWLRARSIITLVVRSASCSVIIASSASGTSVRICAADATTSCPSFGLRFCGIVLDPTVPGGTGSSTSPNSCFISVYISRPIFEQVAASNPSITTYSPRWSAVVRDGIGIGRISCFVAIFSCTSRPIGPNDPSVPAPPPSIATNTLLSQPLSLSICLPSSSIHTATFSPNVAGTACWPCVLPGSA